MKKTRIAINGFGRIGRTFFRAAYREPSFEFAAINDLADATTLAYLLKYDSVYGRFQDPVRAAGDTFEVGDMRVRVLKEKDPSRLPWKELEIDIVIEASGLFASYAKVKPHLDAGAKRVVITAPADNEVVTALIGVNDDRFAGAGQVTSNASCTTNATAPVMAILHEALTIQKATMTTVHSYTATQRLVDGADSKDLRRGRAGAVNIVPSSTGAAEAVIQAIPDLAGKFDAVSVRVPSITGSLSVISAHVGKKITREEVNRIFKNAAAEPRWKNVIKYTEDPLVSSDIVGEPYAAIFDSLLTKVLDGDLVNVYSWYDNEAGYSATLMEHVRRVAQHIGS